MTGNVDEDYHSPASVAHDASRKCSSDSGHAFAHTDPAFPGDASKWELLFTPDCRALSGEPCEACERLDRNHGHLNKVAWWTGKFAEEMFAYFGRNNMGQIVDD